MVKVANQHLDIAITKCKRIPEIEKRFDAIQFYERLGKLDFDNKEKQGYMVPIERSDVVKMLGHDDPYAEEFANVGTVLLMTKSRFMQHDKFYTLFENEAVAMVFMKEIIDGGLALNAEDDKRILMDDVIAVFDWVDAPMFEKEKELRKVLGKTFSKAIFSTHKSSSGFSLQKRVKYMTECVGPVIKWLDSSHAHNSSAWNPQHGNGSYHPQQTGNFDVQTGGDYGFVEQPDSAIYEGCIEHVQVGEATSVTNDRSQKLIKPETSHGIQQQQQQQQMVMANDKPACMSVPLSPIGHHQMDSSSQSSSTPHTPQIHAVAVGHTADYYKGKLLRELIKASSFIGGMVEAINNEDLSQQEYATLIARAPAFIASLHVSVALYRSGNN